MQHYEDANPVCFDAGFRPSDLKFSPNGKYLVLSGSGKVEIFNTINGDHIKSLMVTSSKLEQKITAGSSPIAQSIVFDKNSFRMAIGIDETIYFANIRPNYIFGCLQETLIYKYENEKETESQLCFWNTKTFDHCVKKVKNLISIATDEVNYTCVLAKNKDRGTIAVLCNNTGSVISSKKIDFLASFVTLTEKFIIIASGEKCIFWLRDSDSASVGEFEANGLNPSSENIINVKGKF